MNNLTRWRVNGKYITSILNSVIYACIPQLWIQNNKTFFPMFSNCSIFNSSHIHGDPAIFSRTDKMNDILRQYEKPLHWNVILALLWQNSVRVAGNFTNNSFIIFKCLTDIECFRPTGQLRTGTLKDFIDNILAYNLVKKVSYCTGRVSINMFTSIYQMLRWQSRENKSETWKWKREKKGCSAGKRRRIRSAFICKLY